MNKVILVTGGNKGKFWVLGGAYILRLHAIEA